MIYIRRKWRFLHVRTGIPCGSLRPFKSTKCYYDIAEIEGETIMDSKIILVILAVIGVMTICSTLFRGFWLALIGGGLLFLGIVVVCIFLLGVFVGSSMKR